MYAMQYVFIQFAGFTTIGSASTLLMLRTIAVWNRVPLVTVPLVLASMGQWGLLLHGIVTVRSSWSDAARACVITSVSPVFMESIYMYSESLAQFLSPPSHCGRQKQDSKYHVECSNVIGLDSPSAYNDWTGHVSKPLFTLATYFPTGNHLFLGRIYCQLTSCHLSRAQP